MWGIVTRPESIPEWFPGIESCTVSGNIRVIRTGAGIEIPEEILTNDPLLRRFVYRIKALIYRFRLGVIDVIAISEDDSLCVYSTTAEPDVLALVIAGGSSDALSEIKRLAEASARAGPPTWVEGASLPINDDDAHARFFGSPVTEWDSALFGVDVHVRTVVTRDHLCSEYGSGTLHDGSEGELYDLRDDPQQRVNGFDDPAYAGVRATLHERLREHEDRPGERAQFGAVMIPV